MSILMYPCMKSWPKPDSARHQNISGGSTNVTERDQLLFPGFSNRLSNSIITYNRSFVLSEKLRKKGPHDVYLDQKGKRSFHPLRTAKPVGHYTVHCRKSRCCEPAVLYHTPSHLILIFSTPTRHDFPRVIIPDGFPFTFSAQ